MCWGCQASTGTKVVYSQTEDRGSLRNHVGLHEIEIPRAGLNHSLIVTDFNMAASVRQCRLLTCCDQLGSQLTGGGSVVI